LLTLFLLLYVYGGDDYLLNLKVVSKTTKCLDFYRDFPRFFSKMHRDFADFLPGFSYSPRYTRPKTVTRPGTNRARRALTSFMRRTPLTTTPTVLQCTLLLQQQLTGSFLSFCGNPFCVGPVWAWERCRISPPRFLAECCKRQLNQGSFVSLYYRLFTFSDLY